VKDVICCLKFRIWAFCRILSISFDIPKKATKKF
jgi:hypothetical protein